MALAKKAQESVVNQILVIFWRQISCISLIYLLLYFYCAMVGDVLLGGKMQFKTFVTCYNFTRRLNQHHGQQQTHAKCSEVPKDKSTSFLF